MFFENAFKIVSELVNDFKANEQQYLNPSYSEADVRNDFINKFFIALGWDVRHEEQKNPYEQEVRVEKPVQFAKAQKRADYSFSLAPNFRTVKFFVEAKKPAHALENKDYYFQTARYGWNANTPIAILTDFEEFHIIDCRFRPTIDDALNYKLKKFHYTDYKDEEKFAEIYWLFSREAVANNSLEKYADELPKPRGKKAKGLKAVTQTIDDSFLEELDEIRTDLAKSFKKNNAHLSSEELTEAVQRTIDRLVFIKFLEDKLIEPDHYVSEFGGRKKAWEDFLLDSRKLDAKYNGAVFKKSTIDSKSIIEPDDKTFSAICEELSHENTPYNFDAIPIHILGSIYERFLGKVVNATDKRVTIEEKPEVRKAGGVYYTPQYIVNYIVDNTVGKLIEGKTPKEIAKMRFADIACGSGSFLITVFERLLDYHKRWYINNPEQAKKDGCILVEGTYRLSLKQKTKILLNNVYGVDIDQQAVEVTQLSLYLKLLEDETTATANDSWVMFKEQLLPDLNKNIVCGNSLIGTDILNPSFVLPFDKGEETGGVGEVNELKLKPMDFETVFPEVMKAGGFDAVVGNPPYLSTKRGFAENEIENQYLKINYKSAQKQFDSYILFLEKATNLLRKDGDLGYIIPKPFLTNENMSHTRLFLLESGTLKSISDYGTPFPDANVEAIVLIYSTIKKGNNNVRINLFKDAELHKSFEILQTTFFETPNHSYTISSNPEKLIILKKIESNTQELKNLVSYFIRGIEAGKKDSSIRDIPSIGVKKLLRGLDVTRYDIKWSNLYVKVNKNNKVKFKDPSIYEVPKKILIRRVGIELQAAIDFEQYWNLNAIYNMKIENDDEEFVVGIFNSKLISFWFKNRFVFEDKLFPYARISQLEKIPIPLEVNTEVKNQLIGSVKQMLTAKKQLQQAKTESDKTYLTRKCETLDKQIDELVYQLYSLTEEEIKIVEGK